MRSCDPSKLHSKVTPLLLQVYVRSMPMIDPFARNRLGGTLLENRFVRSATFEGMAAEDGSCTDALVELYTGLSRGGVGLIITGHAFVEPRGRASPRQIGIHRDDLVVGLQKLTDSVHDQGSKIVLQLAHAGNFARCKSPRNVFSTQARGNSTTEELTEVKSCFIAAAQRARLGGFDGVQLHAAHGYFLSQFLSPATNQRQDAYGVDAEGRGRFLCEIIEEMRSSLGQSFPIMVKINCEDFIENGLSLEDSVRTCLLLAEKGIDAIELSGGLLTDKRLGPSRTGIDSADREAYFQKQARYFKKCVALPLILVGGIRSYSTVQRLLAEGIADYISMSRPLICEPDLIKRWKNGNREKSRCDSDNRCLRTTLTGRGVYCVAKGRGRAIDNSLK